MPPEVRRRVIREALAVGAGIVVGAVLIAIKVGTVATAAGIAILGLALVGATALVFMEIGLSEDRERAEGERRRPGRDG
jgi:threonine/homoserine/homoserine lactone efflux protein